MYRAPVCSKNHTWSHSLCCPDVAYTRSCPHLLTHPAMHISNRQEAMQQHVHSTGDDVCHLLDLCPAAKLPEQHLRLPTYSLAFVVSPSCQPVCLPALTPACDMQHTLPLHTASLQDTAHPSTYFCYGCCHHCTVLPSTGNHNNSCHNSPMLHRWRSPSKTAEPAVLQ
jgi:hypothetical protein